MWKNFIWENPDFFYTNAHIISIWKFSKKNFWLNFASLAGFSEVFRLLPKFSKNFFNKSRKKFFCFDPKKNFFPQNELIIGRVCFSLHPRQVFCRKFFSKFFFRKFSYRNYMSISIEKVGIFPYKKFFLHVKFFFPDFSWFSTQKSCFCKNFFYTWKIENFHI